MIHNITGLKKKLVQVVLIAVMLLIWEFVVRQSNNTLIPSPTDCFVALYELIVEGILLPDLLASLGRVFVGFAIAMLFGLSMGFLLGLVPPLKQAIMGILELFRPIPPIA